MADAFISYARTDRDAAAAVVALWPQASSGSDWVHDWAAIAKAAGKLGPASIDGAGPPLGFQGLHTMIRCDERGNGLSVWTVDDFSLEAMVADRHAREPQPHSAAPPCCEPAHDPGDRGLSRRLRGPDAAGKILADSEEQPLVQPLRSHPSNADPAKSPVRMMFTTGVAG